MAASASYSDHAINGGERESTGSTRPPRFIAIIRSRPPCSPAGAVAAAVELMAARSTPGSKMALASSEKKDAGSSSSSSGIVIGKRRAALAGSAPGSRDAGGSRQRAAPARRAEHFMEEEEEDINKEADAFIRRFREELRLQRLQSIENYNQMLERGL